MQIVERDLLAPLRHHRVPSLADLNDALRERREQRAPEHRRLTRLTRLTRLLQLARRRRAASIDEVNVRVTNGIDKLQRL